MGPGIADPCRLPLSWWSSYAPTTRTSGGRGLEDRCERPDASRLAWLSLIALTAILGLGSRRYGENLPGVVAAYAGDTLWALAAFLGNRVLLPNLSTGRVAALAISFSVIIEVSQLYHAPWIDSIRRTTLGGLVLGYDFVWSDLACYAVGVGLGMLVESGIGVAEVACQDIPIGGSGP